MSKKKKVTKALRSFYFPRENVTIKAEDYKSAVKQIYNITK